MIKSKKNMYYLSLVIAMLFVLLTATNVQACGCCHSGRNTPTPVPVRNITVTFVKNAGDATGVMATQKMVKDRSTALNPNQFVRPGYTFVGWSTTSGGSVVYRDRDTVRFSCDKKLYAVWKKNVCNITVTFDPNGADVVGEMAPQQMEAGRGTPMNINQYSRPGYAFLGWSISPTGTVSVSDGATVAWTHNITLYAVWGTPQLYGEASYDKQVAHINDIVTGSVMVGNRNVANVTPCYDATVAVELSDFVAYVPNSIIITGKPAREYYYDSNTHTIIVKYDQIAPGEEISFDYQVKALTNTAGQTAVSRIWADGSPVPVRSMMTENNYVRTDLGEVSFEIIG